MSVSRYLPSGQFALLVGALLFSAGLVYGAQWYTKATTSQNRLAFAPQESLNAEWESVLEDIQAQDPAFTLPEPPSEESVASLLEAAQGANLTDTIGRTLLINLSSAKSQGLGDDIPTQEQIIAQATAQLPARAPVKTYTSADLYVTSVSVDSMRAYGNGVIEVLAAHPNITPQKTLLTIGLAIDEASSAPLEELKVLKQEAGFLVSALRAVPVPQTLVPIHLQLINGFAQLESLYPDLATAFSDPLRSVSALQAYQAYSDEIGRVFTTIAQQFSKNAIIFNTDEPGSAWNVLLTAQ